ncbi:MAG: hypothetical protein P8Y75_08225 [Nitrospirota bacterium]
MRRKILLALYEHSRPGEGEYLDTSELFKRLKLEDLVEYWEDIRYLHDEEYVDGTPVPYMRQGYMPRVRLTAKGLAVAEDPEKLDRAFPGDPARHAVEAFLKSYRLELEKALVADEEKERIFLHLERLASHPVGMRVLEKVLTSREAGG